MHTRTYAEQKALTLAATEQLDRISRRLTQGAIDPDRAAEMLRTIADEITEWNAPR